MGEDGESDGDRESSDWGDGGCLNEAKEKAHRQTTWTGCTAGLNSEG